MLSFPPTSTTDLGVRSLDIKTVGGQCPKSNKVGPSSNHLRLTDGFLHLSWDENDGPYLSFWLPDYVHLTLAVYINEIRQNEDVVQTASLNLVFSKIRLLQYRTYTS